MARKLHPDTNPGDPHAAHRFQRITAAYEALLADPDVGHDTDDVHTPTDEEAAAAAAAVAPDPAGPEGPRDPFELPQAVADQLTRLCIAAPVMWAAAGFPWLLGRVVDDLSPLHAGLSAAAGLVTWFLAGAILWSRAPALRSRPPRWRSPGWEGTALLVRVVAFLLLSWGSTSIFLLPLLEEDDTASWTRVPIWVVLILVGWLIAGKLPQALGYSSRHDHVRHAEDEGIPAEASHPPAGPRQRVQPKHPNPWGQRKPPASPLSF